MTYLQLQAAWDDIRATQKPVNSLLQHRDESKRMLQHFLSTRNAPYTTRFGRRYAKGRAKGYGMFCKDTRIREQVPMERVYKPIKAVYSR